MALGIDHLTHLVRELSQKIDVWASLANDKDEQISAAIQALECSLQSRLEGMELQMATRADLDAVKAAIVQAIADAMGRVSTDLQNLRDQIAAGNPVTDQDLADLQADVTAIGNIDPTTVPTPPPTP